MAYDQQGLAASARKHSSSGVSGRRDRVRSVAAGAAVYLLAVLPAVVVAIAEQPSTVSATDGTVTLDDFTAPNLIGDSNVQSQPDDGRM